MLEEEIGFIHGVPENPDKIWERQINGQTFVFKKERVGKNGLFLYNCKCSRESGTIISTSSTGFHSDRNLAPDEVEQLPQFAGFISSHR